MGKRITIGNLATDQMDEPIAELVISSAALSFRPIGTFIMAILGFAALTEVYNAGSASRWAPDDVALLDAHACGIRLEVAPAQLVASMTSNGWPEKITFRSAALPPLDEPPQLKLGALEHFLFGLSQALLTSFYEDNRKSIEDAHGKSPDQWPEAWSFGRVVRNALSHGGRLEIRRSLDVKWRRVSYTQADHGRSIVNKDLWPGDLIVLLTEMEAQLPRSERGSATGADAGP